MKDPDPVALFLPSIKGGGTERSFVQLANSLAEKGYKIHFLVGNLAGNIFELNSKIKLINFASESLIYILYRLITYLILYKPYSITTALDVPNILVYFAKTLSRFKGKVILCQRSILFADLENRIRIKRLFIKSMLPKVFMKVDYVISNNYYAANQIRSNYVSIGEKIHVIRNFVDFDNIQINSKKELFLPNKFNSKKPTILSVGSLTTIKDRSTLIKSFYYVCKLIPSNLVILGEGPERLKCESLVNKLDINGDVYLLGLIKNPYPWISKANLIVSSSLSEGCPNNIIESILLRKPIVATDCPGDTSRILLKYKPSLLVPIGDPFEMSQAILKLLSEYKFTNKNFKYNLYDLNLELKKYEKLICPGPYEN